MPRLVALIMLLTAACREVPPPRAEGADVTTETPAAPAAKLAPIGPPERVVKTKSLVMWIEISGDQVFYLDTIDESSVTNEALYRVSADGKSEPEEITRGRYDMLEGAKDHLILFDRDHLAQLINISTKEMHPLGPTSRATYREGAVYIVRPASEDGDIEVEAVTTADPTKVRRLGTIPRGGKLSRWADAILATQTDLYVAVDEPTGRGVRDPGHIFRIPLGGGVPKDVASVTDLHDLHEVAGRVIVGSLAKAHVLERDDKLTPIPGTFWDILRTDGKVAYLVTATLLPVSGIGGWLDVWTPPEKEQRIYDQLRNPQALALGDTHVYWFDWTTKEILRLPRVDRFSSGTR